MKLYADEDRASDARGWPGPIITSALSLPEVLAAVWGKVGRGELADDDAATLDGAFMGDVGAGRFAVIPVAEPVVLRALTCVRRHRLRAADAIQLASALEVRGADPETNVMAVFDRQLRAAARAERFALLPED